MNNTISTVASNSASLLKTDSLPGSSKQLGQNEFLQLLVKQIQFQDPLNPKSNTDMAAQMAQFTSLQQASQSSSSLAMLQASSLIGNTVTLKLDAHTQTAGVVAGVTMKDGSPQLIVDGNAYSVSQVMSVMPTLPSLPPATTT